jgi:hypothetical protein
MPLLVDTDGFAKLGVAGLLLPLLEFLGIDIAECRRLPALPHMLRRGGLPRRYGQPACDALVSIADAMAVAPSASTAWVARLVDVPQIDPGEAELLASAAENSLMLVTGDKRALIAVAKVPGFAVALAGRVVTLEAALLALCEQLGDAHVRAAVAPLLAKDITLKICFSDANASPRPALRSYFESLKRDVAPLAPWEPSSTGGRS